MLALRPCLFFTIFFFLSLGSKSVSDEATMKGVIQYIHTSILQMYTVKNVSCVTP